MKPRLLLAALAAAATIALVAGCGSSSSGSDLASLAPPGTPVFVEGTLRPEGELKSNVDAIAKQVAGVGNLGDLIVEELEGEAASEGEPVDFAKEVEPWLGERGGAFFERLEGEDFTGTGVIVESTDTEATQAFIDKHDEAKEGRAVGLVGDFLVIAEDQKLFKQVEEASEGEALADEDTFTKAISAASDGSLADVYVDVGKLIDQNGGKINPTARQALQNAGIDPSEATAVASIVPGSEQIAVELSSDLGGQEAPTGDASGLLGELPGSAFAGFAVSGFGEQLKELIDSLDEEGIPGTVPPNQLKKGLKQLGIDLEGVSGSLQEAAVFASGANKNSLGGALVLSTKGSEATKTVANIGKLLRQVHVSGVTALSGKYSGFTVRSDELGSKPLVVAAREGRLVIGYGLPQTLNGLVSEAGKSKTLSEDPAYEDAVSSLGDTPISGFADGPAALHLADALISNSDKGFKKAKKYLKSIDFLALGSASQGELATAKLIVGLK
ncbi:MAG TPA: DUF3352 domain-containing protein [Solirubrobacterales bacterium]|nr:DUF3352 domain-containing protein [Solirubrobacterales bacterium]